MWKMNVEGSLFIDPLSDFGFKRTLGQSWNTNALKDLLNALLKLEKPVVEITLIVSEQLGDLASNRKAVFDIHCKDEEGNYFIIEVQKLKEAFFKDRSLYYSTFPIRSQEKKGEWDFELKNTYTIGILDFCFDDTHPDQIIHEVKLIELNTQKVFYDRLTFLYVELPKFNKKESELITREDKWLYVLTHLSQLKEIPLSLADDPIFKQFFMDAQKAHLTELELHAYYLGKKAEWDAYAIKKTAVMEGRAEGLAIGKKEGKEEGIAEGIAEGKAEGKAEGLAEGKSQATTERNTAFAAYLLQNTEKSVDEIAEILNISPDFVNNIKKSQA